MAFLIPINWVALDNSLLLLQASTSHTSFVQGGSNSAIQVL